MKESNYRISLAEMTVEESRQVITSLRRRARANRSYWNSGEHHTHVFQRALQMSLMYHEQHFGEDLSQDGKR